jgi:NitT/TauT family transport system ATP-binding protein
MDAATRAERTDGLHIATVGRTFEVQGRAVPALDGVSLDCEPGSFTALIGPSGCGKSTLLRIIAGLERPDRGSVTIGGATPAEKCRAGALGVAFQDAALLPWRTVRENISLPLQVLRRPVREQAARIDALIALVGLQGFEDARPGQLSGGMRQRVAIARTLVTDPSVLLLDEPFGALDQILRRTMNIELQRIWLESRPTTVLVTHGIDEAIFLADRIVVMQRNPGRIACIVDVPFARPRHPELFAASEFHQLEDEVANHLFGAGSA